MLCGMILPYILSMYALISVCIKKPDYAAERQYKLILGLSFLPVVVLYLYVVKLTFVYDPTPFVLGFVLASVVILIWSRKVYDFGSLASGSLLDSMSDGHDNVAQSHDRVHGRPDLMRHIGQKRTLGYVRLLGLLPYLCDLFYVVLRIRHIEPAGQHERRRHCDRHS